MYEVPKLRGRWPRLLGFCARPSRNTPLLTSVTVPNFDRMGIECIPTSPWNQGVADPWKHAPYHKCCSAEFGRSFIGKRHKLMKRDLPENLGLSIPPFTVISIIKIDTDRSRTFDFHISNHWAIMYRFQDIVRHWPKFDNFSKPRWVPWNFVTPGGLVLRQRV